MQIGGEVARRGVHNAYEGSSAYRRGEVARRGVHMREVVHIGEESLQGDGCI